jgi:virulence factor Mce-like protein
VEYRGVLVGSLGTVHRELHQAVLTIDIDPSQLDHIPAGVTVRLVPRSVFGDLYVDLVPPTHITGHLREGAVLQADTTTPTVELNQALDSGYALLTAIKPSRLSDTLTAVATALDGRGEKLGELVSHAAAYTAEIAPHTAQFIHDVGAVGTLARQVSANSPDLFRIVEDSIALSKSIAQDQATLAQVLMTGPVVASQTRELFAQNRQQLNILLHQLAPVIKILDANQLNLQNTLLQLEQFTAAAARALGHGPYLRVVAVPSSDSARGQPYTAAQCPHYGRMKGPNCGSGAAGKRAVGDAVIEALVDHVAGADTTDPHDAGAVARLKQRLAIANVLLAPVLRSVGGIVR